MMPLHVLLHMTGVLPTSLCQLRQRVDMAYSSCYELGAFLQINTACYVRACFAGYVTWARLMLLMLSVAQVKRGHTSSMTFAEARASSQGAEGSAHKPAADRKAIAQNAAYLRRKENGGKLPCPKRKRVGFENQPAGGAEQQKHGQL
jgi:hypothetical protein